MKCCQLKKKNVLNLGNGPLRWTEHVSESSQYNSELDVSETSDIPFHDQGFNEGLHDVNISCICCCDRGRFWCCYLNNETDL